MVAACFCSYLRSSWCCIYCLTAELNALFLGRHCCCSLALCPGYLEEGLHPVRANTPQNNDSSWDPVSPIPTVTAFSRSSSLLWERPLLWCGLGSRAGSGGSHLLELVEGVPGASLPNLLWIPLFRRVLFLTLKTGRA